MIHKCDYIVRDIDNIDFQSPPMTIEDAYVKSQLGIWGRNSEIIEVIQNTTGTASIIRKIANFQDSKFTITKRDDDFQEFYTSQNLTVPESEGIYFLQRLII